MILNCDAGAERSSSHTGLRAERRPTRTTVGDEGVVNMPRVNPAVAAVIPRQMVMLGGPSAAQSLGTERGVARVGVGGPHA